MLAIRAGVTEYGVASSGSSVRCVRAREGQAVPCFFPLAGSDGSEGAVSGSYWTATDSGPYYGVPFGVSAVGAAVGPGVPRGAGYSVRCVRAREGQAVPLFWIV